MDKIQYKWQEIKNPVSSISLEKWLPVSVSVQVKDSLDFKEGSVGLQLFSPNSQLLVDSQIKYHVLQFLSKKFAANVKSI